MGVEGVEASSFDVASKRPRMRSVRTFTIFVLLALGLLACSKPNRPARCYTAADCGASEVCALLRSSAHTCLRSCDPATSALCTGGQACVPLPAEDAQVDVCLPGSTVVEYATCAASADCVIGAICVQRDGFAAPRCEKLCDVGAASTCMGSQVCAAVDAAVSTVRGTCIVP